MNALALIFCICFIGCFVGGVIVVLYDQRKRANAPQPYRFTIDGNEIYGEFADGRLVMIDYNSLTRRQLEAYRGIALRQWRAERDQAGNPEGPIGNDWLRRAFLVA